MNSILNADSRPRSGDACRGLLLAFVVALSPSLAKGQIDPMIGSDMLNSTIQNMTAYNTQQTFIEDTRTHDRDVYLRGTEPGFRGRGQAGGAADFHVGSDPHASEEARRGFIASIRRTSGERVARLIDADFARRGVRQAFQEVAGPYGLRSDDYGDVFAAYMVTMWMVANQAPVPEAWRVQAVNDQAHWMLGATGLQGSRHERQVTAETMMYELVSAIYGRQEAERVGDVDTLDRMASLARRKFLHSNMDLTDMVLGRDGMVRR